MTVIHGKPLLLFIVAIIKMSQADKLLAGLATLQEEGTLCDIELKAGHQTISAHKAVLAASTPYFSAMFGGKFKETRSRIVTVKDVTFIGLRNVIEFIYTGKININEDNIEDVLPAAHLLQMADIVGQCNDWMSQKLTKNNCFKLLRLAEKYSIDGVETAITDFVLSNFVAVSKTEGFMEISQHALCRYLNSDLLKTDMDEFNVYEAAKTWISKNKITDSESILSILKNVRFGLLSSYTLATQVTGDDLIDDQKECRRLVNEATKYHSDLYNQPFYDTNWSRPRGKNGFIIVSHGEKLPTSYTTSGNGKMDFLPFPAFGPAGQNASLNMSIAKLGMGAIHINNFLFVFGTRCDHGYQNFALRYNASNNTWLDLTTVPRVPTVGFAVAHSGDHSQIFMVGGMHVHANTKGLLQPLDMRVDALCYSIQKNTWFPCKDLPEALVWSAAATLNDHVYVTGGNSVENSTDSVYAYDVKAKLWLTKARMIHKRSLHTLDAMNDKLYAVGGRVVEEAVEVYHPQSNQWTTAVHDAYCLVAASSLVIDNNIYIIGGTKNVHMYEVEKNKITQLPIELPNKSLRNVSAFMTLPNL